MKVLRIYISSLILAELAGCGNVETESISTFPRISGTALKQAVISIKDSSTPTREISTDTSDNGGTT